MINSNTASKDEISLFKLILNRLDSIEFQVALSSKSWLTKHEAAELLNISPPTLAEWRQVQSWEDSSYPWQCGVHYVQQPGKSGQFEYNRRLLEDWRLNRLDWKTHQRAVDVWIASITPKDRRVRKAS